MDKMAALVYRCLRRISGGILYQNSIQRQCFYCKATAKLNSENNEASSNQESAPTQEKEYTFEELLEGSQLMKIRRPQGRAVSGIITNVCNDDLYVDFGGKFEVVVKKPAMNPEYVDEFLYGVEHGEWCGGLVVSSWTVFGME